MGEEEEKEQEGSVEVDVFSRTRSFLSDPMKRIAVFASFGALLFGLIAGSLGMYALGAPSRREFASNSSQLAEQKKTVSALRAQLEDTTQKNSQLSAQVAELTPTANDGTSGLTIVSEALATKDDSPVVDYVVRNDTNKTMDSISLDFRFLDKDGNSVGSSAMGNNAQVEPGKTGVVTVYLYDKDSRYPSAVKVQAQSGWGTINGQDYKVDVQDANGVGF